MMKKSEKLEKVETEACSEEKAPFRNTSLQYILVMG